MKLAKYAIKPEIFNQVSDFVEFLISVHPLGFCVLLGTCPPPTPEEVHEMYSSQREALPLDYKATQKTDATRAEAIVMDYEKFMKSVKLAGGWRHINFVANEFIKIDSRMWNVAADHVKYVANPTSRYFSRLEYVANKNGVSRNTVIRYRRMFPQVLSMMILIPDGERLYFAQEN